VALLILKHIWNLSFVALEREVRANLVYRDFTRVGGGKMQRRLHSQSLDQESRTQTRAEEALVPQWPEMAHRMRGTHSASSNDDMDSVAAGTRPMMECSAGSGSA
jgi:hypothetical protein